MESFLREHFKRGVVWLALFILFTLLVKVIDVKAIGPEESKVGFAALNGFVFRLIGQHEFFEKLTKLLGVLALLTAAGFAAVGGLQFLKTKSIKSVDKEIIILGAFYVVVLLAYVFFELCVVNYRPVILDEGLEASYPSSHTVLVICIMMTAPAQIGRLTGSRTARELTRYVCYAVIAVMVVGRLISGVHWFTDIIGGILLSGALVCFYNEAMKFFGWDLEADDAAEEPVEETDDELRNEETGEPKGKEKSAGIKLSLPKVSLPKIKVSDTGRGGSHARPDPDDPPRRASGRGGSHLAK